MTYGAARERVALSTNKLVKIPDSLDFDRAAGICITYGTTFHALKDRAALKKGESLAVLGAAGGVGLAASAFFTPMVRSVSTGNRLAGAGEK